MTTATAQAAPNIAFIKYWGNRDAELRIPSNGSISMNLSGLETRTSVIFDPESSQDSLRLDGREMGGESLKRVSRLLDHVRALAEIGWRARVESNNNFPTGAGIASSASAFAALSLAASAAAGLQLDETALSRLARLGSGSACRSIPGGFVEWQAGVDDVTSYAHSIADPEHWDLVDCIAMVSQAHKPVGSSAGHALADTSPLQSARVADAPRRLDLCRSAIRNCDFDALVEVMEMDSNLMHAVMMTSSPNLFYWQPATLAVMQAVSEWRHSGLPVGYTIDAGPNVHVISPGENAAQVATLLKEIPGVEKVFTCSPGGPARLI